MMAQIQTSRKARKCDKKLSFRVLDIVNTVNQKPLKSLSLSNLCICLVCVIDRVQTCLHHRTIISCVSLTPIVIYLRLFYHQSRLVTLLEKLIFENNILNINNQKKKKQKKNLKKIDSVKTLTYQWRLSRLGNELCTRQRITQTTKLMSRANQNFKYVKDKKLVLEGLHNQIFIRSQSD